MEESNPIKDILYRTIAQISESKIQTDLANKNSQKIITNILNKAIPQISHLDGDKSENFGVFAESLTHYLLTNALIPSQRKITVKNIETDIVIPDLRTLGLDTNNALIIHFAKTSNKEIILKSLDKILTIQPKKQNILLVSEENLPPYKTYGIQSLSFATIIDDLSQFVASKPQSKFKILRT